MKAIMYHYVQKFNKNFPKLNFLHIDDFKKQLDFFEKEFGFIKLSEFKQILTNKTHHTDGVILTFDDGLKCHYTEVFKELRERGLWGIFYVNSQPILENTILDVHKIHILLGCIEPKKLINDLFEIIRTKEFENSNIYNKLTYQQQVNDEDSLAFKRILNYYLSINEKNNVLNELISINKLDTDINATKYYLTKDEMIEMAENGMILGGHTHSHPLLSKLPREEQFDEISKSLNFNFFSKTFCFPYGGKISYNEDTLEILTNQKIEYCFSVENQDISNFHLQNENLFLPRYDCNFFPHGKIYKY